MQISDGCISVPRFLPDLPATKADLLAGFTVGGDDYITKPFSLEEVVVRIRAVLRRSGAVADESEVLQYADVAMDEATYVVTRGGRDLMRGKPRGPDAPLFIVNHFITLARPSNQTINDAEILGERVEQCAAERGQQPNLIAVDFIGEGDVMQVVDSLNGVD